MRVVWVHPSWRDLVVDHLAAGAAERRAFLEAAELPGVELALSTAGGPHGERALPLLVADDDWDALGDAVHRLARELGSSGLERLLAAVEAALTAAPGERAFNELAAVADLALTTVRRRFDQSGAVWDADALARWLSLARQAPGRREPPDLTATRAALRPASVDADDPASVRRLEAWLAVAAVVASSHPHPAPLLDGDRPMLTDFLRQLEHRPGALAEPLPSVLRGIADVQPALAPSAHRLLDDRREEPRVTDDPPLLPPPGPGPADRKRVRRVLLDL